jgi:ABC-type dipeptide/oligopeptide/nickel transport system permease component
MNFVIRRLVVIPLMLLGVVTITFLLGHMAPGDPFQQYSYGLDDATVADMRHHYGLDQPLWQQLFIYLFNLIRGDMGIAFSRSNRPVSELLWAGVGPTLIVGGLSVLLACLVGIPLGLWSALQHGKVTDKIITALVSFFGGMPGFVLSYFLIWIAAVNLKWFPTGGWGDPNQVVLPVLVASLGPMAFITRVCRASMVEVLRHDYVRVAHAKGLPPGVVLRRHVLRNGFIPVLNVIGPLSGRTVTGLFFIERIFGIPGVAKLIIDSVPARDYSVIQAGTLFLATVFIFINLLVDMGNVLIDPRTKAA